MPKVNIDIRLLDASFNPAHEQDELRRGRTEIGAVVAFVGLVRDHNEHRNVYAMTLEHYPGMTERALTAIANEAAERWRVDAIHIVHRVGRLFPGDPIVLVAVAGRHRAEAFRACEFVIDLLKTRAPFWKKEETETGAHWVSAHHRDSVALKRWDAVANGVSNTEHARSDQQP